MWCTHDMLVKHEWKDKYERKTCDEYMCIKIMNKTCSCYVCHEKHICMSESIKECGMYMIHMWNKYMYVYSICMGWYEW